MKTQIKVNNTRFPRMTRAILRRLDRETLEDVARNSADAGWSGFTYYTDTLAFYGAHKADILALAQQSADDFGQDMLEMIAGFGCLKNDKLTATSRCRVATGSTSDLLHHQPPALTLPAPGHWGEHP